MGSSTHDRRGAPNDPQPDVPCRNWRTSIPPSRMGGGVTVPEKPDAGTFAYQLFEHLADVCGEANADLYASRVVAELFELSPIVREHVSDLILADLVEELHRRGPAGKDAARLVGAVQRFWANERG